MGEAKRRKKICSASGKAQGNPVALSKVEEIGLMLLIHFPEVHYDRRTGEPSENLACEKCSDFKHGLCCGDGLEGEAVIECMWNKVGAEAFLGYAAEKDFLLE